MPQPGSLRCQRSFREVPDIGVPESVGVPMTQKCSFVGIEHSCYDSVKLSLFQDWASLCLAQYRVGRCRRPHHENPELKGTFCRVSGNATLRGFPGVCPLVALLL